MVKTLFEESYLICQFDDSVPVLAHRWKGQVSDENFRNTLVRMANTFKELRKDYPTLAWLGDTTNLGILTLNTQAWLKDKWTPIMLEAGVKHHALIVPKDVFAKFAMNKFKDNIDTHHQVNTLTGHFTDEASAKAWLLKLQPSLVTK